LNSLEDIIDFSLGREATDTESNTAVSTLVAVSESSKNVTGLERGRSACTAGRQSNVLESHEKGFTFDVGKRNINAAGIECVAVTVLLGVLHRKEAAEKSVGEALDAP
jgi:hypothetical protein